LSLTQQTKLTIYELLPNSEGPQGQRRWEDSMGRGEKEEELCVEGDCKRKSRGHLLAEATASEHNEIRARPESGYRLLSSEASGRTLKLR
jgi:hypothetical protein